MYIVYIYIHTYESKYKCEATLQLRGGMPMPLLALATRKGGRPSQAGILEALMMIIMIIVSSSSSSSSSIVIMSMVSDAY